MFKLKLVEKKISHYNTFSRKVKQPIGQSAYIAFLFVRLYLIFFSLIISHWNTQCRQCYYLCLRMFVIVALLMIFAKLSIQNVSRGLLQVMDVKLIWMLRMRLSRMHKCVPRQFEMQQVLDGGFFYSSSYANSIFNRPNA